GEPLKVSDVDTAEGLTPGFRQLIKQLAGAKTPETVAQLVLWNAGQGLDWSRLEALAATWTNRRELALAQRLAERLGSRDSSGQPAEASVLSFEISATTPEDQRLAMDLRKILEGKTILGLTPREGVPAKPTGPALATRVLIRKSAVSVHVLASDEAGVAWVDLGQASIPRFSSPEAPRSPAEIVDAWAESMLARIIHVRFARHGESNHHFFIRIENRSPFVLKGLSVDGPGTDSGSSPSTLVGISLPPGKKMTVPASPKAVQRLRLKQGIHATAANFDTL
ncbi:hypothetical protein ACYOEI_30350, partial [Singulisphaera rosea]